MADKGEGDEINKINKWLSPLPSSLPFIPFSKIT